MSLFVFIGCIAAAIFTSYTHGNKQANDLMVKLGGPMQNHYTWGKYKISLDYIFYWLIPLIAAVIVFGWLGLLYLPFVWLMVAKLSQVLMVGQLKKRLANETRHYDERIKKWEAGGKPQGHHTVDIDQAEHSVNELKWLISHPKMAHHLALSALDGKARPEVIAAFEAQVGQLDSLAKKAREVNEDGYPIDLSVLYPDKAKREDISAQEDKASSQRAAKHAFGEIKEIIKDEDKTRGMLEPAVTGLMLTKGFAEHGSDKYCDWFTNEVNKIIKDQDGFKIIALSFVHNQVVAAFKRHGGDSMLPETSEDVLQKTQDIYEEVLILDDKMMSKRQS